MKNVKNSIFCFVVALAMLIPTASLSDEEPSETNCDSVPWTYLCEQIAAEVDAFEDYFNERLIDGTFFTMEVFATLFAADVDTVHVYPVGGVKVEARDIDEYFAVMLPNSEYNFVDVVDNTPRRIHVIDPYTAVLMRDVTVITQEGINFNIKDAFTLHKHGGNWLAETILAVMTPQLPPLFPLP